MLKIGELAQRSGLSVRTLRHYDDLGLLCPAGRTEPGSNGIGQRLYSEAQVERLWQIQSLKALGLPLGDIARVLADPTHDPTALLERHIGLLEAQLERQQQLLGRLRALQASPKATWQELLEVTFMNEQVQQKVSKMMETYHRVGTQEISRFDSEKTAYLQARAAELGQQKIKEVEQAWPKLMAEVVTEMQRGTPPTDPKAKALAARWMELVAEFTGGREDILEGLSQGYQQQMDDEMRQVWDYIGQALQS